MNTREHFIQLVKCEECIEKAKDVFLQGLRLGLISVSELRAIRGKSAAEWDAFLQEQVERVKAARARRADSAMGVQGFQG